jgi:hypothetical protein
MSRLADHFVDLGFQQKDIELGPSKWRWVALCYLIFCFGIVAREVSAFPKMTLIDALPDWRVPAAAFVIGLALFPPVLRWVSGRKEGQPTIEHFLWCFSFGFFWSLIADYLEKVISSMFS